MLLLKKTPALKLNLTAMKVKEMTASDCDGGGEASAQCQRGTLL